VVNRSGIPLNSCLEFGVKYGYSTAAFATYFNEVTGVDLFTGDIHAGFKENIFEIASHNLKEFKNIKLIKSDYRDFIREHHTKFNLFHVDIVHT
jgi:predicted O-methyltransferase YrrM